MSTTSQATAIKATLELFWDQMNSHIQEVKLWPAIYQDQKKARKLALNIWSQWSPIQTSLEIFFQRTSPPQSYSNLQQLLQTLTGSTPTISQENLEKIQQGVDKMRQAMANWE